MGIALNAQREPAGRAEPALLPLEQAWTVLLPAAPLAGGAMDGERVYIPAGPREIDAVSQPGTEQIVALDRQTGVRRWTRGLRSEWPPAVGAGAVVVAAGDALHALDPESGEDLWRVPAKAPFIAPPALAAGLVLSAAADGVLAVRAADGATAWHLPLDAAGTRASLVAGSGSLYVSIEDGRILRVRLSDGARVWEREVPGRPGAAAAANDRVLVGSTDNHLYALDEDDGRVAFRYLTGGDVVGAAAHGNWIFFVARDNVVRALARRTGNQRWKAPLNTRAAGAPVVVGRTVLVPGFSPALSAFDAETGNPLAAFAAPTELVAPALVDPEPQPFRVSIVAVMGDGGVAGLRPVQLMFREAPPAPLTELPGAALDSEPAPR